MMRRSVVLLLPPPPRRTSLLAWLLLLLLLSCRNSSRSDAFTTRLPYEQQYHRHPRCPRSLSLTVRYNFFQKLLGNAFENDASLVNSNDKRTGMLDDSSNDDDDTNTFVSMQSNNVAGSSSLTETQKAWRMKQQTMNQVTVEDIASTTVSFNLFLTGVPNKDPSNDLYGSKTNISSRDRTVGQPIPTEPTLSNLQIQFMDNGKCQVVSDDSGFAIIQTMNKNNKNDNDNDNDDDNNEEFLIGDWILSDDGKQIRFRFGVNGYQRTIETKGTIQKVYWSKEDEKTTQTSTVYSIPQGWIYAECSVEKQLPSKKIVWDVKDNTAVLKIEQRAGFMGVSSKMIPCGKFAVSKSERSVV